MRLCERLVLRGTMYARGRSVLHNSSHREEIMNKTTTNLVKRILRGWAALLAAAVVVHAAGSAHESFWYDEAYSSGG
jgi:hypothetical protein